MPADCMAHEPRKNDMIHIFAVDSKPFEIRVGNLALVGTVSHGGGPVSASAIFGVRQTLSGEYPMVAFSAT